MRSQQDMLDLILRQAEKFSQVRLVFLNGSRASNSGTDQWQDYDIAWGVTEMVPFLADNSWLEPFGKRLLMQMPEDMELFPPSLGGWHTWLMQLEDGNRIDLLLFPLEDLENYLAQDSQVKLLMDRDGRIKELPAADDRAFWVRRPTAGEYRDCCNEFWWVSPYVAKGLCRHQLLYALHHLETLRKELLRMVSWQVGFHHNFQVSVGKCGRDLKAYLPEEDWNKLLCCWCIAEEQACWNALKKLTELFRNTAQQTAMLGDFEMNRQEADGAARLLEQMYRDWIREESSHVGLQ